MLNCILLATLKQHPKDDCYYGRFGNNFLYLFHITPDKHFSHEIYYGNDKKKLLFTKGTSYKEKKTGLYIVGCYINILPIRMSLNEEGDIQVEIEYFSNENFILF